MKCPACKKAGKRSRVYEGPTTVTAMMPTRYFDEDGCFIVDDPNTRSTSYKCSEGHSFTIAVKEGRRTHGITGKAHL